MNHNLARCHLLARLLAADGIMAEAERATLEAAMERLGLSEQERDQVIHFEGAEGAAEVLRALPEAERRAFHDELMAAALVDGRLSRHEIEAAGQLAAELGLKD